MYDRDITSETEATWQILDTLTNVDCDEEVCSLVASLSESWHDRLREKLLEQQSKGFTERPILIGGKVTEEYVRAWQNRLREMADLLRPLTE